MTRQSFLSSFFGLVTSLFFFAGCTPEVSVVWTEGEADPQTGLAVHTIEVVNAPKGTDWTLWMTSNHIYTDKLQDDPE